MKCPKCQFENLIEAKFCNECGCKLELACPECNKPNPPGRKFCNECGQNLALSTKFPPKEISFEDKLEKIQRYPDQWFWIHNRWKTRPLKEAQ